MPQSMMLEEKHTSSFVIQWVSYSIISFSKFYSEDSHKEYASHFPDRINLMTAKPWTFQCLQYICIYFYFYLKIKSYLKCINEHLISPSSKQRQNKYLAAAVNS